MVAIGTLGRVINLSDRRIQQLENFLNQKSLRSTFKGIPQIPPVTPLVISQI